MCFDNRDNCHKPMYYFVMIYTFFAHFVSRLGHVLNLHTEKVSETAMYEALKRTMLDFVGACLVDYTVTESTNFVEKQSTPGTYIMLYEKMNFQLST